MVTEKRIEKDINIFLDNINDFQLLLFTNKFTFDNNHPMTDQEFKDLDQEEREFLVTELREHMKYSFKNELIAAVKFFQIMNGYSFHGTTRHDPPRFKFKKLSIDGCRMLLISEGMLDDGI